MKINAIAKGLILLVFLGVCKAVVKYLAAAGAAIYTTDCVGALCADIAVYKGLNENIASMIRNGVRALIGAAVSAYYIRNPYQEAVPLPGRRWNKNQVTKRHSSLEILSKLGLESELGNFESVINGTKQEIAFFSGDVETVFQALNGIHKVTSYLHKNGKRAELRLEQFGMETGDDIWEIPDNGWVDSIANEVANGIVYDIGSGGAWCTRVSETNEITEPSSVYMYSALIDDGSNPEFTGSAQCESDAGYDNNA